MSAITPLRSTTAQKRTMRDSTALRYPANTPNNEETEPQPLKENTSLGLKAKLDVLLRHNSQLLNENGQLSELVNSLRMELEIRTRRQETQFAKLNEEMGSVMIELKAQQDIHQSQLQRLLNEISKLHDQCHQLQIEKSNQLRRQQQAHERQIVHQIAQIKRSQDDGKSLTELQITKLKEVIEMKDFQFQSFKSQMKGEIESLKNEKNLLESELQHQRKLKELEINEMVRRSKDDMRSALKHLQLEKNVEIRQYENRILKLKKDVANKDLQIDQYNKKTTGQNQEVYLELSSIKKEKQYLLEEIQSLTEATQEKIVREKERIAQLGQLEKENLQNLFKNQKQSLQGQKKKLLSLTVQKSEQIKRLYENIKKMKETYDTQREQFKSLIQGLRNRLKSGQLANNQETQMLKIKMAQLHRADVQSLSKFYENEVAMLHLELRNLREAHDGDRQKLYALLQENDELRKTFQVQISKQKAKIQDMKVKFAAARLQFKEQITSLGTKMQLTSQSLVRETDQKQRGAEFFETEKRKFYQIIESKDKEIQSIHQTMIRLKQLNEQEITQLKIQINMLRDSLLSKDQQFKEFKINLEQQYQRKSLKIIQEAKGIAPDQELEKELHEIKGKFTQVQKENFKFKKQLQFSARQIKSLQQELGLRNGFIETMQLESCAAIEDQKSKVKILMGKNQVAMKDYYEGKLHSREQDNESLKKQLKQKEADLRTIATKYSHLERRLRQLLEAQDKLTDFENKIVHLGLDQNLIKNMAQLFHHKQ